MSYVTSEKKEEREKLRKTVNNKTSPGCGEGRYTRHVGGSKGTMQSRRSGSEYNG